jgi:hypothetical protein
MLLGQRREPASSLRNFLAQRAAFQGYSDLAPQKILRTTCCESALFAIFPCNMSWWTKGTEIKLVDAAVNALHVLGQGLYVAIPARIG